MMVVKYVCGLVVVCGIKSENVRSIPIVDRRFLKVDRRFREFAQSFSKVDRTKF